MVYHRALDATELSETRSLLSKIAIIKKIKTKNK